MAGDTHYEVLGVSPSAETADVRKAYVSQARRYHPDFHVLDDESVRRKAEAQMRSINEAWAVLGRGDRRDKYDRELRASGRSVQMESNPTTTQRRRTNGSVSPTETMGTAPPRWLTVVPALCLVIALFSFILGFITGLVGLLAAGLAFALSGAVMFLVAPMVALKRSKGG